VKITPAHDFNDYQVGKRNGLETINILTDTAHLNDNVPEKYRGLERFAARKQVVADLEAEGFLLKVEDKTIMQPFGDRSQVVIEPYLTDQWYVDAKNRWLRLRWKPWRAGKTRFVPSNWDKTYYEWMRNIEPWCVSRQLWWGHRIPAWFGPRGSRRRPTGMVGHAPALDSTGDLAPKYFVAATADEALELARAYYGDRKISIATDRDAARAEMLSADHQQVVSLWQDEDVLDTWFSSALWPFSTMGWPQNVDPALKRILSGRRCW